MAHSHLKKGLKEYLMATIESIISYSVIRVIIIIAIMFIIKTI